jgi:hypothetical protein
MQEWSYVAFLKVLVDSFFCSSPITVIVDDEDAADRQPRPEVYKFVVRGAKPIRIQSKKTQFAQGRAKGL